jgi:MoaA/NifB/PqqE/SkfB family radical SAM enzyme
MDMALIEKIATELGRVNYSGLLALFSNNEPLLDERIVDICALFRNRVKGAHIYLYTNGIRITPELYLNLFRAGLDEMIIDNYSEKGELIAPVRVLLDEISENGKEADTYKKKTRIFIRRKKEVLTNRGGSAPNKTGTSDKGYLRLQKTSCALPFMQMVIRPTGEVSLCCQDALGKVTLGDVSRETIAGVWNGKAFIDARTRLRMFGRGSVRLCSLCDVSIIYTAVIKRKLFGLLPFSRRGFRL